MLSSSEMQPVCQVLDRVSLQLDELGHLAAAIQVSVGRVLRGDPLDDTTVETLQRLDYVQQVVENISVFLKAAAEDLPPDVRLDIHAAVRGLSLANVAHRLSDARDEGESPPSDSGHECEFF